MSTIKPWTVIKQHKLVYTHYIDQQPMYAITGVLKCITVVYNLANALGEKGACLDRMCL